MTNLKNKNNAQFLSDDLDNLLDGVNLKSYPEELIDNKDKFDFLLAEKLAKKTVVSNEQKNTNVDKLLEVTDMERPSPKLVKIDSKSDKKYNIDALLDSFADDDSDTFIDLIDDKDDFSKADILSIVSNKNTNELKEDTFDLSDDFEALDEFGANQHFK